MKVGEIMDNVTFATEMIDELKATSKRWFVLFLVVLFLWFATIGLFVWYISLPSEDVEIEQAADNDSYNQVIGGDYVGSETANQNQTPSKANTDS